MYIHVPLDHVVFWTGGNVVRKYLLSRALAALFLVGWNHLCNIGKEYYEEQICEITLNLDEWLRRKCRLKIFLIYSSGSPFVQRSGPFVQLW